MVSPWQFISGMRMMREDNTQHCQRLKLNIGTAGPPAPFPPEAITARAEAHRTRERPLAHPRLHHRCADHRRSSTRWLHARRRTTAAGAPPRRAAKQSAPPVRPLAVCRNPPDAEGGATRGAARAVARLGLAPNRHPIAATFTDHRPSPGTHIAQPTAGIAGDPHVLLRRPPAWRSEAGLDTRRAVGVRAAHRRNGMQPKTGYD